MSRVTVCEVNFFIEYLTDVKLLDICDSQ